MEDRGQNEFQEQMNREPGSANNQQGPSIRNVEDGQERGEGETQKARSSNRGFAAMDPQKQKQIASEGGRAAHRQGVAHEWSSDEAREAGRKGGQIVSRNREHMSEIGRRGGQSSGSRRGQKNNNEGNDTNI
jgi:uncharacterized protein